MKPLRQPKRSRKRGQALVEFGLVVMLFVLLLSGVFDFGMLLNTRLSASSLSRELARAAALGAPQSELIAEAQKSPILGIVTDTFVGYCCSAGDAVVVSVNYLRPDGTPETGTPVRGDRVQVVVQAKGADVVTPLMRPIFGCLDGSKPHCFQELDAQTTMYYEGAAP